MTEKELSELSAYPWMPSRIPLRDALVTFVRDAPEPDPVIAEMQSRLGQNAWYPVQGGHRVLMPHDGGAYDAGRFTIEPRAWDHEHCSVCQERIPAMTLCYVTRPDQPYVLLCSACYERHVASKLRVA
jgi:hypothetical protein